MMQPQRSSTAVAVSIRQPRRSPQRKADRLPSSAALAACTSWCHPRTRRCSPAPRDSKFRTIARGREAPPPENIPGPARKEVELAEQVSAEHTADEVEEPLQAQAVLQHSKDVRI